MIRYYRERELKIDEERVEGEEELKVEGQEDKEFQEQRERIKTLLHAYYQEKQLNTPTHRELAESIEEAKQLAEQALPFFKGKTDFEPVIQEVKWFSETKAEIAIFAENDEIYKGGNIGEYLLKKEEAEDLGKKLLHVFAKIEELNKKLLQEKENIARELLQLPEYAGWQGAKLELFNDEPASLYNTESIFIFKKDFYQEGRRREEGLYGRTQDKINDEIMKKYGITPEERDKIVQIEWTEGEKKTLRGFLEGVETFKGAIEKAVPLEAKDLTFTESERENMLTALKHAQARNLYKALNLPPQHRERVLQEVMMGTFTFIL